MADGIVNAAMNDSTTVGDLLAELDKWGAAHAEVVFRDDADEPVAALIIVKGIPETGEFIGALEALQEKWDADDDGRAAGEGDTRP